jgi:hypothetical protein
MQSSDALEKYSHAIGLNNIVISTCGEANQLIHFFRFSGEHQDTSRAGAGIFSKLAANFDPIDAWQHEIKNHDVRLLLPSLFKRFAAIKRAKRVKSFFLQIVK